MRKRNNKSASSDHCWHLFCILYLFTKMFRMIKASRIKTKLLSMLQLTLSIIEYKKLQVSKDFFKKFTILNFNNSLRYTNECAYVR